MEWEKGGKVDGVWVEDGVGGGVGWIYEVGVGGKGV